MNSIPPTSGGPSRRLHAGGPFHAGGPSGELNELLEALCEDRLTDGQMRRMEELVLADKTALRHYLDYIAVHGALLWDTAKGGDVVRSADATRLLVSPETPSEKPVAEKPVTEKILPAASVSPSAAGERARPSGRHFHRRTAAVMAAAMLGIVAVVGFLIGRPAGNPVAQPGAGPIPGTVPHDVPHDVPQTVTSDVRQPDVRQPVGPIDSSRGENGNSSVAERAPRPGISIPSAVLGSGVPTPTPDGASPNNTSPSKPAPQPDKIAVNSPKPEVTGGGLETVAFLDDQIRTGWESSSVRPSPLAEETEWLRRVHLDLVGRIPTPDAVEKFLKDRNPSKRQRMVDQLLDDPLYVRHWTTVWTNLLIGRSSSRDEIRFGLEKFLRQSFAYNRPWSEVVSDLVSAEGTPEENGASGFLLAHLNNEAVPATAITSRLFLGVQIQCSQCHCNPFNDRTQNQFWEFNSFFQQTARVEKTFVDPKSGKPERHPVLVTRETGGPMFYEAGRGVMRAAFPRFGGEKIDSAPTVNRRRELARLMIDSSQDQVARAMVNRTWEHFFGAGFTRSVDDMGPHNPPTHPAVLERLTDDFVKSGYDIKQLIRWICATEAYQRSSRFGSNGVGSNGEDDPTIGNQPLFSRVYVKSMTAEQLYDSMLVATRADDTRKAARTDLDRQRHDWIQQFVVAFDNEENNEAITFDGTIPQALMMMNSDLVSTAVSREPGTYLSRVLRNDEPEPEKIKQLCLAALSRQPTSKEMTVLRKMLRERTAKAPRAANREIVLAEGLQDVFWAFLNSNEFVLVH